MITTKIAPGVIDVHAHWLPRELFGLPPGGPYGGMHDRGGQLHIGDIPLSIDADAMCDVAAIRTDMRRAEVGVRVLSSPPFAFPLDATPESNSYASEFNSSLTEIVQNADGSLLGLGMVTLGDPAASTIQLQKLASTEGIAGVAVPPVAAGRSLDGPALHHVLSEATRLGLAVLVHPMQLPRPEWADYYLANLIGNPVETATAVASLLLSGIKDELPGLRICFVHGGGCAAGLLGRWVHGWEKREDVRRSTSRPPDLGFKELYFDTVVHDRHQLALLGEVADRQKIVCGSDYPFDMAEPDPVKFATSHGPGKTSLVRAGRSFLGLDSPAGLAD